MLDADELEWYVPAAVLPSGLQSSLNVINQFLETPIDLEGKKAAQMIRKKRRSRRRRVSSASDNDEHGEFKEHSNDPDADNSDDDGDEEGILMK